MAIQISCDNCQTVLRVEDQHAGKSARCPNCSELVAIPFESHRDNAPPNPYASENPYEAANPYTSANSNLNRNYAAHRGPSILVLGIGSLLCCNFLGIPAVIMANEDLKKMNYGEMDPEGRGMTQAGKIIGIVGLVMMVMSILSSIFFFIVTLAAGL